jgi:hypothetical protein
VHKLLADVLGRELQNSHTFSKANACERSSDATQRYASMWSRWFERWRA